MKRVVMVDGVPVTRPHFANQGHEHKPDDMKAEERFSQSGVRLVYFSSVTENTKRFVEKLGFDAQRIAVRRSDEVMMVDEPYVLVMPTYGGDGTDQENSRDAIPPQVKRFLNVPQNRSLCRGVIGAGNTNFGKGFVLGAKLACQKMGVPLMYSFELLGTPEDVEKCQQGLIEFFTNDHGIS